MYQSKTHSATLADVYLRVRDIGEVKARGLWCNVDPAIILNWLPNVCLHNAFAIVSQRDGGIVGGPTSSGGDGGAAGSEGAWEEAKVSYCAILAVSANRLQCHQLWDW